MADLFTPATGPTGPHTGRDHPETSFQAAEKIRPALPAIRNQILSFASNREGGLFIDDDMEELEPDGSRRNRSFIPRRIELTDEGWLLDSGKRKRNAAGNQCVVWIHRDFVPHAPPVRERERETKPDQEPLKKEAREMAQELAGYAASLQKEGRMVWRRIEEAARIMRALSR